MRFDIEEFGIDPSELLESLCEEYKKNDQITKKQKLPLDILINFTIDFYQLPLPPNYGVLQMQGVLPRETNELAHQACIEFVKKLNPDHLHEGIDNLFVYLLLATQFHKTAGLTDDLPTDFARYVEDCTTHQLFSKYLENEDVEVEGKDEDYITFVKQIFKACHDKYFSQQQPDNDDAVDEEATSCLRSSM